jgi:orotidine-5'-phosphate decarboxylase
LEGAAHALLAFDLGLLEALSGLVPAVLLPVSLYEALGWRGLQVLEEVIAAAREKGFFVIADAKVGEVGSAASLAAQAWLGTVPVGSAQQAVFGADCLTVSGYAGSEAISPVLETCLAQDKCFFTLVKTPNPSGGEVQAMVAGDRVVYQVVGDLTARLGRETVGKLGYSRAGAAVGTSFPSDLRALRKRLPETFFLVSGLTP